MATIEQARLWIRTTAQGFTEQEEPQGDILDVLAGNFYAPNATCFFAWVDGQPAGGGGMYYHDGAVELGGASTRPQYRRRGVHAALVIARLAAAHAAGCDMAVVQTSHASDPNRNLKRLGFQQMYTRLGYILTINSSPFGPKT